MKQLRYEPNLYSAYRTLNDLVSVTSDLNSYYNLHCSHTGPCAVSQTSQVGFCLRTFALAARLTPAWNGIPQIFAWVTLLPPSILCSYVPSSVKPRLISFLNVSNFKTFQCPTNNSPQSPFTLLYFFHRVFIIF